MEIIWTKKVRINLTNGENLKYGTCKSIKFINVQFRDGYLKITPIGNKASDDKCSTLIPLCNISNVKIENKDIVRIQRNC